MESTTKQKSKLEGFAAIFLGMQTAWQPGLIASQPPGPFCAFVINYILLYHF
jgi:hypothetical protein